MTREEIKKAIENGESVWLVFEDRIYKLDKSGIIDINDCYVEYYNNYHRCNLYATTSDFYETEARAKHFISHCGVTRIETLPFLTWEEFKSGKNITFKAKNGHEFLLKAKQESIYLWWLDTNNIWKTWDLTEANFYKAYDECVRLFKGEV